jgi:peptide/nickel transport system permease protein
VTDRTAGEIAVVGADTEASARRKTSRLLLRRKTFVTGASLLTLIVAVAALAPVLAPHDPIQQDLSASLAPPLWAEGGSMDHPLGTDTLGRDTAARLMYGARNSLVIAFFAVLIASILGLAAGVSAGFSRGWWGSVLMRLGDIQLAFPFILLAIIVLGVLADRNAVHLILVLGIPGWILYARVVRSRVLAERDKDYVTAAKSIGASRYRQMRKYVLPSVWQVVLVIAMVDFGFVILVESTLSFLGLGLTPPTPSWGLTLAEGRRNMIISPWLSILPGLAIMVTVLAINLTADGAADVLDPKLKKGIFGRVSQKTPAVQHAVTDGDAPAPAGAGPATATLLSVRDLSVEFPLERKSVKAVRSVSFDVDRGETLGIVGESGSGKSVTALSIIQLLDSPGRVTGGEILFEGRDLTRIDDKEMAALRGKRIGMVFQNPASSLNPVLSIGSQMVETIRQHEKVTLGEGREKAANALLDVGIGDPRYILSRYPFQLSGGMNQRVMIAMAMLARPDLLIADEPTTALDVTTQAQVLEQLHTITREHETALILITHDIALVREYADNVVVLYAGQVCESGPVGAVIRSPQHPYTQALLESVPRGDLDPGERLPVIRGELPDPTRVPVGCPFAPRCRYAMDVCVDVNPPLEVVAQDRLAACHLATVPASEVVVR